MCFLFDEGGGSDPPERRFLPPHKDAGVCIPDAPMGMLDGSMVIPEAHMWQSGRISP